MPNTILHFGPNSYIAFLWRKYIDYPAFIIINVFINFESYLVILFRFKYPIHGYLHTFLISSLVGALVAALLYSLRSILRKGMRFLRLGYETDFRKILISSLFGAWLHILLDAPVYAEMQPFFPIKGNPWYLGINEALSNIFCAVFFIPAFILYRRIAK